ncbi:phosphatase domain-containing protein [Bdellovibrio bacteriovorus]|uniref:Phosphatidate phosphatase APP1 catalytic domain-containing protein n=1 Tax=Bdellovibrio bacteriovorus (strain ATCC 15356 / DSM 50701 / NCIMB 9529 / HD100) TaxID=264462 RepID=Q6MLP8_BDEBA|nr:phosphatase domain-containing protein [Bdellovibrio bacteriovorus]CAE79809.1 conserved hypothetical protein [Bdellovibrio bacteriovorus HD100]
MKTWIAFILLFVGLSAQARTLLVSDVDDTIKLAHIKDLSEAARYAFDSKSRFAGMSELYHLIAKDQPDLEIVYLSRAPDWFMGRTHRKFLENGNFPDGEYINRTNYDSDVHKIYTLREVMAKVRPDKVIFVGDNGEQDPEIYKQISEEFAGRGVEFHQFIRVVYPKTNILLVQAEMMLEGQTAFVTPVEVALDLEKAGILKSSSVQNLIKAVLPKILDEPNYTAEGEVAFPYFVNCRDMVWKWDDAITRFDGVKSVKDRIVNRCKLRP